MRTETAHTPPVAPTAERWFVCWGSWDSEHVTSPAVGRVVSLDPWRVEEEVWGDEWLYPREDFDRDVASGVVVLLTRPKPAPSGGAS